MDDHAQALADALQTLATAAGQFALHASRQLAAVNPPQYQLLLNEYASGLCDLRVTVALDRPPHVRLALHLAQREEVLFDSVAGLPQPTPPASRQGPPTRS